MLFDQGWRWGLRNQGAESISAVVSRIWGAGKSVPRQVSIVEFVPWWSQLTDERNGVEKCNAPSICRRHCMPPARLRITCMTSNDRVHTPVIAADCRSSIM